MELIATVRDGHTVLGSSSRYARLGWLPFSATWRAHGAQAGALGGKVLEVDGRPIDLVL